tara:strand:- start:7275 stop:8126 length:852 start_codon:yes stop_codon:yes gene_type:complete
MILVTGHRGYIGSLLYNNLLDRGYDVIGIDLKEGRDILHDLDSLEESDVKIVFHLAAFPSVTYSVENPSHALMNNVLGTSRLLEWSEKRGVERFIFSSSSAVYGNDGDLGSPYALHKLMSEKECKLYADLYGLDTVCLRYFNVYSEGQPFRGGYSTVISAWMESLRGSSPLVLEGDGLQTRDFVHVDDVIDANLFAMRYNDNFGGETYDIASGETINLQTIKKYIDSRYNTSWEYRPGRFGDIKHISPGSDKMKALGWKAKIPIKLGLEKCFGENSLIRKDID